jgi:hypothetical protein
MRHVRYLCCHALILGVQSVPDDPDVLVLYAHKVCHSERRLYGSQRCLEVPL